LIFYGHVRHPLNFARRRGGSETHPYGFVS
jgi:hypothetical protein